jgi:prepilin-type N-terminal cleavage/methylation domain-containing protein
MLAIGPTVESRHRNGFTLVELLIVIVIIGILATIAVPKFSATKEKAYDRAVMSDIRRAHVAIEAYAAENMTYPASANDAGFTPSSGVTFTRWDLQTQNGILSVHLHAEHAMSTHYYHSHYPADAELEQRNQ